MLRLLLPLAPTLPCHYQRISRAPRYTLYSSPLIPTTLRCVSPHARTLCAAYLLHLALPLRTPPRSRGVQTFTRTGAINAGRGLLAFWCGLPHCGAFYRAAATRATKRLHKRSNRLFALPRHRASIWLRSPPQHIVTAAVFSRGAAPSRTGTAATCVLCAYWIPDYAVNAGPLDCGDHSATSPGTA